ncbi:hypothetical protein ES705_27775 [subsurface metagenome]
MNDKTELYIPQHHSVSDWDFEFGADNRSLSPTQFVSAPTSLLFKKPASGVWMPVILCRHAPTLVLPEGEVRTWVHSYYPHVHPAIFRNQAALNSANSQNCYEIYITETHTYLHRYIAGGLSVRASTTGIVSDNQWWHYRTVFWNGETPGHEDALCVNVFREVDSAWVQMGGTLYDTSNYWKDSVINRAGFRARSFYDRQQYWDDTEIWGPV